MKALILAGTAEARLLSHQLERIVGVEVVVSLAGRTSRPADHGGTVRVGGFGGADGLAAYLAAERIDALVDATHPFAATISAHAAEAADRCGVPRLQLVRPPWEPFPHDRWVDVGDVAGAASALRELGADRVLLTVGRTDLDAFTGMDDVHFVVRSIERPAAVPLADFALLQARGPFTVTQERDMLRRQGIDAVVSKNSGGEDAKLVAARELGVPVVMIRRPPPVPGVVAHDVPTAVDRLRSIVSGP